MLHILRRYGGTCIPVPRATERFYWSVSCLPSTSDKPLVRVNASWMELFTLYADDDDLRSRFVLHLTDFTIDGSWVPAKIDKAFIQQYVGHEDLDLSFPSRTDLFILKIRGGVVHSRIPCRSPGTPRNPSF